MQRPVTLVVMTVAVYVTGFAQVVQEDAGRFLVEHKAVLEGSFREARVILPIPLNWPMQTASELTVEPKTAQIVLDDSKMVGLAVLSIPGPETSASVTLRYKVQCHPPKFDTEALTARDYPDYDTESPLYRDFTRSVTRIESADPSILALGARFAESQPNPCRRAKAIYDYVIDQCDYVDVGARGALAMLRGKSGCCADYAMLFAAICRAAGIPARECGGFIATKQNRWHSWAEFYLPGVGWVPCDPQVGDDNDHTRATYFGGLGGSAYVALSKRHDLKVLVGEETLSIPFIQSGRVTYEGTCRTAFRVSAQTISEVRHCILFTSGGSGRVLRSGLSQAGLEQADEEARKDAMRCISVAVAPGPSGPEYAAIWEKDASGGAWRLYPRLTLPQLRALLSQAQTGGFMPICLASCALPEGPTYATVLASAGGMTWTQAAGLPRDQFTAKLRAEAQSGHIPAALAAHIEGDKRAICSGVFIGLGQAAGISTSLWAQGDRFEDTLARYHREGLVPVALAATAGFPAYFHTVAMKTANAPSWRVTPDLTGEDVQQAIKDAAGAGLQPLSVCAY